MNGLWRELLEVIDDQAVIVRRLVRILEGQQPSPQQPVSLAIIVDHSQGAELFMRDNQQVRLEVAELDAAGNPVDQEYGTGTWTNDNETVVRVDADTDGLGANVVALGPLGVANVTLNVQLPDDTTTDPPTPGAVLQGVVAIQVVGDDVAAEIAVTVGEPTDQ